MFKKLALAAAGLTLLISTADAEAASKPRLMIMTPKISLNSAHIPPIRIVRLKLRSRVQVSSPTTP